ncbi:cellulose synthase (UDP-forming) [Noviherbaspirillum humi]|uniref:Cellulose synthase (UDP-forming) n=1 Tax=Noviherbaspirillum humi TaxID=1688639 RepID=A0A239DNZ9_9BURK|nr:cellulose synthase catalytic subunit [Noviherbaspirillum humi]SNS33618.1 cellulose synthase (UDP-forming) [Noviherbaspirillum humi]
MGFYFEKFESRQPPEPVPYSPTIELIWQFLVVVALILGANYIRWRWMESLNYDALWFSIPVALAETFAYIGLILFTINLWMTRDEPQRPPPFTVGECGDDHSESDRPISVDIFITTYNEEEELVRISIRDARAVRYPHPIDINVHVLDDGRRPLMRQVAEEEGANYITRSNNIGFKAGNLRNAMEQTSGDFIVICDADTRLLPTILEDTLGYFRDKDMAWVQTPQWFYDIPEGVPLPRYLEARLGRPGRWLGRLVERVAGKVNIGEDPFVNDPKMFYDVILRRRNWANAAFCCGAASIHRREAVMQAALRAFAVTIDREVEQYARQVKHPELRENLSEAMRTQAVLDTELTPYKFHVSEDIYTSIVLHSDPGRRWRSVLHPKVESKMLSPQDLLTWMIQRFKYAGGTLDICFRDNPLFRGRMTLAQRLMYLTTFWSYLGCIWNFVFLVAPIIYLFTGVPPLKAYAMPFYLHVIPFIIMNELAFMFGTWGIRSWEGKASYLSFFSINFRALWTVLKGEKIKFHVTPKDRQEGNFLGLVVPQIAIVALTAVGLLYAAYQVFILGHQEKLQSLVVNAAWGLNNIISMLPMIRAALWQPPDEADVGKDTAGAAAPAST